MAKAELLSISNERFPKGVALRIWKEATVVTVKKAGKSAGAHHSFLACRPNILRDRESNRKNSAQPPVLPGQDTTVCWLRKRYHPYLNARFIICTDGSATGGTLNGCGGKVVSEGEPANPSTLLTKLHRGAVLTSSYNGEKVAIRMAPEWRLQLSEVASICTGRQYLLKATQGGSADTSYLRRMNDKQVDNTTLPWTSGYNGIAGI